jgi:hypothetical protein
LPSYAPDIFIDVTEDVLLPIGAETIPALTVALDDLEWFDLPPLARRMLRHIDGAARLDEICSKAGDSLTDAIRLVEKLAREGLLSCR